MTSPDAEARLLAAIAHTAPLTDDDVPIPGSEIVIRVTRPAGIDHLLDQAMDDPEQNLPYWCELWPSGIALAAWLLQHPDVIPPAPIVELGSGVGITAAVAVALGADLIATDYSPESLVLTRLTTLRHAGREPRTHRCNWRDAGDPLLDGAQVFPLVLAADVLYERRDIDPLLDLIDRIVAPDGRVLLAEPGRPPAKTFLERAAERGWKTGVTTCDGPWPDPSDAGSVVSVHNLVRAIP